MGASQSKVNTEEKKTTEADVIDIAAIDFDEAAKRPTLRAYVLDEDGDTGQQVPGSDIGMKRALLPRGNIYESALVDGTKRDALLPQFFIGRDCIQREQERLAHARAEERCARRAGEPCGSMKVSSVQKQYDNESKQLLKNWNQKQASVYAGGSQRNATLSAVTHTLGHDSVAKQPLCKKSTILYYNGGADE